MVVNQFKRFCKMIAVCNNNFGMIAFDRNDHLLTLLYRVNFISVYNNPDI